MASQQLVIFRVNEEHYGIGITQVDSIIKPLEIYKIPNTPEYVEGLINLRGKVYTVFNLRKRFGLPDKEFDDNTKIIITKVDSMVIGLIVDEVNEILTFEDKDIENTPQTLSGLGRKFVSGIAKKGDQIIMMLNLNEVSSVA